MKNLRKAGEPTSRDGNNNDEDITLNNLSKSFQSVANISVDFVKQKKKQKNMKNKQKKKKEILNI